MFRLIYSFFIFMIIPNIMYALPWKEVTSGNLLEQQERLDQWEIEQKKESQRLLDIPTNEPTLWVNRFELQGSLSIFSKEELLDLLLPYTQHSWSLTQLNSIAEKLTQHYHSAGYSLAKIYIPEQTMHDGIIVLEVIEGQLDPKQPIILEIPPETSLRVYPERLLNRFHYYLSPEYALNLAELDTAILQLNEFPGVFTSAELQPGQTPGTTQIILKVAEGPVFQPELSFDNFGSRYTGKSRLSGSIRLFDPAGYGEQWQLDLNHSMGAGLFDHSKLTFNIPVFASGLQIEPAISYLKYKVGKEFSSSSSKGRATSFLLTMSHPWLRNLALKKTLRFRYQTKDLYNEALQATTSHKHLHLFEAIYESSWNTAAWLGGLSSMNLTLHYGRLNLSSCFTHWQSDQASDGAHTDGPYKKIYLKTQHQQRFTERFSMKGSLETQWASKNLDSSEKMQLGGPAGIRAFPTSEAVGDMGALLQWDNSYLLYTHPSLGSFQGFLSLDYGYIRQYRNPDRLTLTTPNHYHLSGYGTGLQISQANRWDIRWFIARRLGNNPGRNTTTGMDGDGSLQHTRMWLQVQLYG